MTKPQNNTPKELTIPSNKASLEAATLVRGQKAYDDNPFLESFSVQIRKKGITIAGGMSVERITDAAGEEVTAGKIVTYQEVDKEKFLKIFTGRLRDLFEITPAAQKTLIPLMHEIQKQSYNAAEVFFPYKKAEKACVEIGINTISNSTYIRGIKNLIERNFIAYHANGLGWFWTNPAILFNGDRVAFVDAYKIKRKTKIDDPRMLRLV